MKVLKGLVLLLLFAWGLVTLFPLIWMFLLAVKPGTSVISTPPDFSLTQLTLDNFRVLFANDSLFRWSGNSLLIALSSMLANVVFCSMAGYVFAKKSFPGKTVLFWMILMTMMISNSVIIVPLFMLVKEMGLLNSYAGVILPLLLSPFGVFLSRQFISTLPDELLSAARIDGCSEWRMYSQIIVPLCLPVLAIIAIFSFISNWNEFLWPMIATDSKAMRTLQVGLASMQLESSKNYGTIMAGSAWTTLPIIVIFVSLQRFFIRGITVGGVKG